MRPEEQKIIDLVLNLTKDLNMKDSDLVSNFGWEKVVMELEAAAQALRNAQGWDPKNMPVGTIFRFAHPLHPKAADNNRYMIIAPTIPDFLIRYTQIAGSAGQRGTLQMFAPDDRIFLV